MKSAADVIGTNVRRVCWPPVTEKYMMRVVILAVSLAAGVLAAALSGSGAFAQILNYPWCLMTRSAKVCSFVSMSQCLASRRGNTDFCVANNTYSSHAGYSGGYYQRSQ